MVKTFTVTTPEDFQAVVAYLLETYPQDDIMLALRGDLGAGKTTFTQQLAKQLGVIEPVTSPTFTIMKVYELEHERFDRLVHIDAYRLEDESEAAPLRLMEVFAEPRTITCLVWPEQIAAAVPPDAIMLAITINPDESREVTITSKKKE